MYCVYMSTEYLDEEPTGELYGEFVDENYDWRESATAEHDDGGSFLDGDSETDVDLLTGEGSE
jgi:hypothetical protein